MKRLCIAALALCAVLSACGGAAYEFPVIDGDVLSAAQRRGGDVISGRSLVYTAEGNVFYAYDYEISEELTGVITSPPERTQMDVYKMAAEALDDGERTLIIYIDGLGWDTYKDAVADGDIPALAGLTAQRAASMWPTITPVNYAAMVTGAPPAENGVTKRGVHIISCPTIFDYAAEKGLASYVSEGDTQILALPGAEMELSPDLNDNGTGDDEIFDCAMENIEDYPLLFVHFHSVDDASHEFSPDSDEARAALIAVDGWCSQLMRSWEGRVIIASDHGQHSNDGTGDPAYSDRSGTHGDFAPSDIFVPLLWR